MARYQKIQQRKAKEKQSKKKSQSLSQRYLMNELAFAIINNRSIFVVQKIMKKLQHSLNISTESLDMEIQSEIELDEWNSEGDNIEDIEEVEEIITEFKIQESSAKTIWSLISIVRMLTESAKIKHVITSDDIQKAAFKGTNFTDKEKTVSAKIVNFLRPFVQKRTIDNYLPKSHILIYAPLAALANYIATITGFPSLVRKLSITSKNIRSLHLTAAGVYDVFHKQYDVPVDDTNWITNSNQVGKNKPAIFQAFFNINQIESLMDSYGLQFA
jgi:hypothetical protein